MTNKVVDKDSYSYRDDNATPDAEKETAYKSKKEIEGADLVHDRNGNSSTFFKGGASAKKDTSRIADQTKSKITKVLEDRFGSMYESGHMKKLGSNSKSHRSLYRKTRKYEEEVESDENLTEVTGTQRELPNRFRGGNQPRRFRGQLNRLDSKNTSSTMKRRLDTHRRGTSIEPAYYAESENPQVASSPASSDNPMLGMYAVNTSNNNQSRFNLKTTLESIALQAAEAFEALDVNNNIPETFASELDQCSRALDRLHSYVVKSQPNISPDGAAVPAESPNFPLRREEYELDEGIFDSLKAGVKKVANTVVKNIKTQVPANLSRRVDQDLPITRLFKTPEDSLKEEKTNIHHDAIELHNDKIKELENQRHKLTPMKFVFSTDREKLKKLKSTLEDAMHKHRNAIEAHKNALEAHEDALERGKTNHPDYNEAKSRASVLSNMAHNASTIAHKASTLKEELEEALSAKQSKHLDINPKDGQITKSDLDALRARKKMEEAVVGIFNHLVERNKNADN